MAENVDFSVIWQHFKGEMGTVQTRINLGFLRLKYSFYNFHTFAPTIKSNKSNNGSGT